MVYKDFVVVVTETVPAPRAKCLDTILCLDVSESVVQAGDLELVKNTALRFVDGKVTRERRYFV
jgi:hypothetical protein